MGRPASTHSGRTDERPQGPFTETRWKQRLANERFSFNVFGPPNVDAQWSHRRAATRPVHRNSVETASGERTLFSQFLWAAQHRRTVVAQTSGYRARSQNLCGNSVWRTNAFHSMSLGRPTSTRSGRTDRRPHGPLTEPWWKQRLVNDCCFSFKLLWAAQHRRTVVAQTSGHKAPSQKLSGNSVSFKQSSLNATHTDGRWLHCPRTVRTQKLIFETREF